MSRSCVKTALLAIAALFIGALLDRYQGIIPKDPSLDFIVKNVNYLGDGALLVVLCALLLLIGKYAYKSDQLKLVGLNGIYALVVSGMAVHVLKAAFERPRFAHSMDAISKLLADPSLFDLTGRFNSFPSGHTTSAFAVAYVLSKRFPRLKYPIFAIAVAIGAGRVYLGSHFPSDVVGGAILGITAGWLVNGGLKERRRWLYAGLALLVIIMSFFKTGSFLLFDVDEAVFSEAAREMLETGDFITPTYNYEPRYDKPILIYWFMTGAYALFGVSEFSARFTSAAFSVLLVLMTYLFVRRVKDEKTAILSGLVLLLNIEFFVYSHSAVTDMTLSFFITASLYSFHLAVREDEAKWMYAFWGASALATLTKGAIGLVFPVTIAFITLIATRDLGRLRSLVSFRQIALYFVIAAPWFVIEASINGMEFFNAFILKHHVQRYSAVISSHSGPFYYYIAVLLIGFFPWVAILPFAVANAYARRFFKGPEPLLAIWFLFVLIFFSAARTKLPNYIFSLFAPISILAGCYLRPFIDAHQDKKKGGIYAALALTLIASIALFVAYALYDSLKLPLPSTILLYPAIMLFVMAIIFAVIARYPRLSLGLIFAIMTGLIIFMRMEAVPPVNTELQKTLYDYSIRARELRAQGWAIASYETNKPSIAFYSQGRVEKLEKKNALTFLEERNKTSVLVITTTKGAKELTPVRGAELLDERGGYALISFNGTR